MIIGLCGPQGVGKTTIAKVLVERHNFKRIAFADALREAATLIFGLQPEHYQYPAKEEVLPEWGRTPRQILQLLGTEVARHIHPDVWVRAWERQVERESWTNVVADDVRFDNEVAAIRRLGGKVMQMQREGAGTRPDAHASEHGLTLPPDLVWTINHYDFTYRMDAEDLSFEVEALLVYMRDVMR